MFLCPGPHELPQIPVGSRYTVWDPCVDISIYINICTYANSYTFCSRPARTKIQKFVATPSVRSKFQHDLVRFLLIVLLESIVDLMEVRLAHHPDDVAVIVNLLKIALVEVD